MKIASLEIHSTETDEQGKLNKPYEPPIINVDKNGHEDYVRITRYYNIEQLTYAQWHNELAWFKDINTIIDGLEVDMETRSNIIKFLGKKINKWYFQFYESEPVCFMSLHEANTHKRWVREVYRLKLSAELPEDLAMSVYELAIQECRDRIRELDDLRD